MSLLGVVLLAGGSIAALLADIFGIAPMHLVFWWASVPSMVALAALGTLSKVPTELRQRIRIGALAGLAGTIGYDLARVPFALAGQRLFAPIESYGLLIADAAGSSPLTSTLGWLYHFSNGITFGIAYAAVAARRHWAWGVLWAMALESVAVFSPFATRYGLAGQLVPIAIAYGAHLCYGYPLGRIVQRMRPLPPGSVALSLVLLVVLVLGWHRPWTGETPAAPTAVVQRDRFEPEWLRIRAGQCVTLDNRSDTSYDTPHGVVAAQAQNRLCFTDPGIYRLRLGTLPYSGGFIYVAG